MSDRYESLKLDNQLCFPLYACSKEIVRQYKPYLDKLNLTYTQYIVLLVLWECGNITLKKLGEKLFLDSGTLTPVVKSLENKGYVNRRKSELDERSLIVSVTQLGMDLRERALEIPEKVKSCVNIDHEEFTALVFILRKILWGGVR